MWLFISILVLVLLIAPILNKLLFYTTIAVCTIGYVFRMVVKGLLL